MQDLFLNVSTRHETEDGQYTIYRKENAEVLAAAMALREQHPNFNESAVQIHGVNGCFYCGFYSPQNLFQKIGYGDRNSHNIDPNNTFLVCPTCFLSTNLSYAAFNRLGFLAYVPEMKQVEINYIFRIVYAQIFKAKGTTLEIEKRQAADEMRCAFEQRSTQALKMVFEQDFSDGVDITRAIKEIEESNEHNISKCITSIRNLRWIPNERAFPSPQLKHYIEHGILNLDGAKI